MCLLRKQYVIFLNTNILRSVLFSLSRNNSLDYIIRESSRSITRMTIVKFTRILFWHPECAPTRCRIIYRYRTSDSPTEHVLSIHGMAPSS